MSQGYIGLFLFISSCLCIPSASAHSSQSGEEFIFLDTDPLMDFPEEETLFLPPISDDILGKTSQPKNLMTPYKGDDLLMADTYYRRRPQEEGEPVNVSLNILKPDSPPTAPRSSSGIITYKDYKRDVPAYPLSGASLEEEVLRRGVSLNIKT